MSAKELRAKAADDLQAELLKLRREQFSLRMQAASGQTVKSSDFSKVKKSIARVKTVQSEKARAGAKK
jgi:large subunit ribosomal protein L29